MQKLLLSLLAMLFLISCEKENSNVLLYDQEFHDNASDNLRRPAAKIDVCHYDAEYDTWHVINISENAWPDHAGHGDVQLIDQDGDGYVTSSNECGLAVDCDDTDAGLTDNCPTCFDGVQNQGEEGVDCGGPCPDCPTCFDGIQNQGEEDVDCGGPCTACSTGVVEIDFNGPLFVAPSDEPGLYTWQQAIDVCNAKDTDGFDWFLPNKDELNALYVAKEEIGGFAQSTTYPESVFYWSSSAVNFADAYAQNFVTGFQGYYFRGITVFSCRCVSR